MIPARRFICLILWVVKDLARAIQVKPFKIVADLMEMRNFNTPDETVDFETAAIVARKHGYQAQRPPPVP